MTSMTSLLKDAKITVGMSTVAAGTSAQNTAVVDMNGYDRVCFILKFGDVADTSVLTLTAYENTANSTSSPTPTAVTGGATAATTASATSADNKLMVVDIGKNAITKQYVFATLTRATANAVIEAAITIQYNGKALPITAASDILASVLAA